MTFDTIVNTESQGVVSALRANLSLFACLLHVGGQAL